MWRDTYKVSKIEGYPLAWDKRDMEEALQAWTTHQIGDWFEIGDWKCRFHRAGHIPGAVMIEIETPEMRILWTGDMDTRASPNVLGALPVECDVLFLEGTYGNRVHPPRVEEEERLVSKVLEVVDRGGTALIPAFASGRGQDVLRILKREAPNLEAHYHGMGTRVTQLWMEHPESIREPKQLAKMWRWCRRVSGKSDRRKALDADVIVSTSGMLDGGPAIWYANRLRHHGANAILLTGYQAEGSGGRLLLDERKLRIFGDIIPIDLEVEQFSLSNHAGQTELVTFARACAPRHVVIFHADEEGRAPLSTQLTGEMKVHLPSNRVEILLE
jgi:putative mRNA 3-end processing factor|tara:strand:- start:56 stop:1042 length:987 start_codon:yes stop_codon:yes gene_type:complete